MPNGSAVVATVSALANSDRDNG
jgi:hypothetical protein